MAFELTKKNISKRTVFRSKKTQLWSANACVRTAANYADNDDELEPPEADRSKAYTGR